jgi:hypothetical protein
MNFQLEEKSFSLLTTIGSSEKKRRPAPRPASPAKKDATHHPIDSTAHRLINFQFRALPHRPTKKPPSRMAFGCLRKIYQALAAVFFFAFAAVVFRLIYFSRRVRLIALLYCLLIVLYIRSAFRFRGRYYDNWSTPIQSLFTGRLRGDHCLRLPNRKG